MTSPPCADPAMHERLLDAARPPTHPLSRPELAHVEVCASCRIAVERARRVLEARRALAPSPGEIARARARFEARRACPVDAHAHAHAHAHTHTHTIVGIWPRAITIGLVLAAVASAAAQIVVHRRARPAAEAAGVTAVAARRLHHHARRHAGGATDADVSAGDTGDPIRDDADDASAPTAHATSARRDAPPAEAAGAFGAVGAGPSPRTVVTGTAAPGAAVAHAPYRRRPSRHQDASSGAARATLGEQGDPAVGGWAEAADALRAGDQARAERALAPLTQTADEHTRDAARLARAQLWLAEGRRISEARSDLQDLAATSATPLIRQRAREALAESW